MTREAVIERLQSGFDDGDFLKELADRVAVPTESQVPESAPHLRRYLETLIGPELAAMGYGVEIVDNPVPDGGPFLVARRIEGAADRDDLRPR